MKKRATLLAVILFLIGSLSAYAQFGDVDSFLRAGAQDAKTITRAYLKPLPSGLGADINSGWVNSAKTHKTLGFDLQIRGALSFIPESDRTFDLNNLDLNKVSAADPMHTISPTAGGNDEMGPEVVVEDNGDEVARFNLPEGTGYSIVPAPMVQAGLGLVKNTDLIVRFIPKISYDDTDFKMTGFGLKHGINQWLPGGNILPVEISILGGFTKIDVNTKLDLQPENNAIPNPDNPEAAAADFDNQRGHVSLHTFTVKALVGKSLPFISIYGGVGYETSRMDVDITGDYPASVSFQGVDAYDVIEDPFSYDQKGQNKISILGGATLKMAFFHLFGEFTLAEYPTANAGIGFSFR